MEFGPYLDMNHMRDSVKHIAFCGKPDCHYVHMTAGLPKLHFVTLFSVLQRLPRRVVQFGRQYPKEMMLIFVS